MNLREADYRKKWKELMKEKERMGTNIFGSSNLSYFQLSEIRFLKTKFRFREELTKPGEDEDEGI